MANIWNLSVWDKEADYLVLDDVPFLELGGQRKGLWGAQEEIGVTGKWMRCRSIKWGKPMIFCCNEDNFYRSMTDKRGNPVLSCAEIAWYDANSVVVEIDRPLFMSPAEVLAIRGTSPEWQDGDSDISL